MVGYNSATNVKSFTSAVGNLQDIQIVDVMIYYECPYTGKKVILAINNVFYVEQNEDNLLTPFLVCEAGH